MPSYNLLSFGREPNCRYQKAGQHPPQMCIPRPRPPPQITPPGRPLSTRPRCIPPHRPPFYHPPFVIVRRTSGSGLPAAEITKGAISPGESRQLCTCPAGVHFRLTFECGLRNALLSSAVKSGGVYRFGEAIEGSRGVIWRNRGRRYGINPAHLH